jgi:hypothetical protein
MKQSVSDLYRKGRSRTVHGTSNELQRDWTKRRALAETLARLAVIGCLAWAAKNSEADDPVQLRSKK